MAKLTVDELIDKKFITDVSIATALKAGDVDLNDDYVKDSITQVDAYQNVYGEDAEDATEEEATTTVVPTDDTTDDTTTTVVPTDDTTDDTAADPTDDTTDDTTTTVAPAGSEKTVITSASTAAAAVVDKDALQFTDGYAMTGEFSGTKTNMIYSIDASVATTTPIKIVDDFARYLRVIHDVDGVEVLTYEGTNYTWDNEGTLKGSNYKDAEGNTLVSVVTVAMSAKLAANEPIVLEVKDGNKVYKTTIAVNSAE